MKTACVIQGDIRENFELVLIEMKKHFDILIVSTWNDEKDKIQDEDVITIFSEKPHNTGYTHRNYQRYSTARGIEKAKELGADYVLKWRTDLLPTKLNVNQLIDWANFDIPNGLKSRIVTCAYRNLTVYEDWFSSIPDLFAFGDINTMELLWGDTDFEYTKMMNPPKQMLIDEGTDWIMKNNDGGIWCAESELYGIFKDRLQRKLNIKLSHEIIVENYMRLFDHNKLGLVWFGKDNTFRCVVSAWGYPWWTESKWRKNKVIYAKKYYKETGIIFNIKRKLRFLIQKLELLKQNKSYNNYFKND